MKWSVRQGFFDWDFTIATRNSERCETELNIIPDYTPPETGKVINSKIGAELTSLYETYSADPSNFQGASDAIFQIDQDRVFIEAASEPGQYIQMLGSLEDLGVEIITEDPGVNRLTGWVQIPDLLLLNEIVPLLYARPVYPGISNYVVPATGLVNSQGDQSMRSDFARLGFDVDGTGVRIGVLSNSYDTKLKAAQDIGNGDLPGLTNPNGYASEVLVLKDITQVFGTLSDEGRAMLQIIHDIAPGAELAFRTGYLGEQDMADGILELAAAGCDIIVDDITYITEPFFRDGVISKAIDQVVSEGVVFFSSAGNFGNNSHTGVFSPAPAPPSISGEAHDFGAGDVFQSISLQEGNYTLVLQWDDGSDPDMATTQTDLDIFLTDNNGATLLGFNRENTGGFPIEVVPFSIEGEMVMSDILVARASGPNVPVNFKYIVFRGGAGFDMLEYVQGTSTIVGHPNAEGAISVGAVRYDKNPVFSPDQYPVPEIMSFSSTGATPGNGAVREKPDITAPNGINTTVDLGNGDWEGDDDDFPNFFGTSAASPHAAAVAALLIEARKKFDPENPFDPEGIRTLLRSTAIDMDTPGRDFVSGDGFIQAHLALLTFANPSPVISNLLVESEGVTPGDSIEPFTFQVSGDFFTGETQLFFRGEPLMEGVTVEGENTITVNSPGFLGNPLIQAYTNPISPSGLDGGFSDSSFFSDPVKQDITITAGSYTKKF